MSDQTIAVGQKWRDMDKRMRGRIREIVAIGSDQSGTVRWAFYEQTRGGTRTRIRADRLRKFFELVKE